MSDDAPPLEPLFSYGTLQDAAVQRAVFGRLLAGTPDALPGFRRDLLAISDPEVVRASGQTHHPVVRRDPAGQVPGTLFLITAAELARADAYEDADYRRVRVRLASGREAWLYVAARDG